ncbi:hypothetical protein J6590_019471 [Homalodisca vitripennis]|nr:hypothetical protein J6590_019471 [Homalodisca vitripennis]
MSCCAVATCPNNSKKTKGSEQRVVYHKFPKTPFVVPSIKLPTVSNDDDDVRNERIEKRRVRKNAHERLDSPKKPRIEPLNTDRLDESNLVQPSSVCEKCENLLEENNNLKSSIDVLEQKITNLRREHDILYKSIAKKRKMHSKTLSKSCQDPEDKTNVCKQAIHVYARVRTFIRLRNVNSNLECKRKQLKKAKKWIQ